jgi:hypothetical protein
VKMYQITSREQMEISLEPVHFACCLIVYRLIFLG